MMDVFFRRERRGVSIVSRQHRRKVYLWRVRKPKMKTRGKGFEKFTTTAFFIRGWRESKEHTTRWLE